MFLYFYISPLSDAISLIQAAAPIFRQLCPDPPGEPINLPSLLQHPLSSLRLYAGTDILFNVVIDMPMLFRYEVAITNTQHPDPYPSTPVIQSDGIIQWRHGMSDQIILVFAKMKAMRQDGSKPSRDAIESLERDICEIQPPRGSSSERFLAVMRSVVNECWRQAAFIYLYMAVRGEPSSALSVKQAFKGFMKLLNGTRSGRIPDEFLILPLILISPAAQRNHDREAIRRRLLGLHRGDRTHIANYYMLYVIEDCWARADAEGRSIMWSDVAISRMKVLGV
ncbi:fungal-specific transcription factor domain-containing protein [Rhizoctonia solani]|nr:fungal-specific transcription factor domain-containing protein [Rhizoctonia solani]